MSSNLFRRGETYYGRFSVNGQLQRVSLRTSDLRTARKRLKAIRDGAQDQAFGLKDAATWEEAVVAYTRGVLDTDSVKPATAKRYLVSLRQVSSSFVGKRLPEITTKMIVGYVSFRQAAGATNATIRRDLTTISRVLAYAKSQEMVEANVVDSYDRKMVRERRAGIEAPDDAEVTAAAAAVEADGQPEFALALRFLRANGVRAGEALRARWEHIRDGELTIHETKNGRVRTIAADVSMLAARRAGRLFPGLPEDTGGLAGRWAYLRRNLPDGQRFRIHDLRHAYAIAQVRAGRDIYDLSHHLGHSSVKVTEIYLGYATGRRAARRNSKPASDPKGDTASSVTDTETADGFEED